MSQLLRADVEMILRHTNDIRFRGTPSQVCSLANFLPHLPIDYAIPCNPNLFHDNALEVTIFSVNEFCEVRPILRRTDIR